MSHAIREAKILISSLFALAVCHALITSLGRSDRTAEAPPPPPARFDPRRSDSTFRWLIQIAKPIGAEKQELFRQRNANPLTRDFEAEEERIEGKGKQATVGILGKTVTWPAVVKQITAEGVIVDGWPGDYKTSLDDFELYLEFGGMTSRPTHGGLLRLGEGISLADARELLLNDWIFVTGTIGEVRIRVEGYKTGGYITIRLDNNRGSLPKPAPGKPK